MSAWFDALSGDGHNRRTVRIRFDDLFLYARAAVCHLRVYDERGRTVVLAGNPDDNPGASVINAARALRARVETAFGLDPITTRFICFFPGDTETEEVFTEVISTGDDVAFERLDRAVVENLIGASLEDQEASKYRIEDIGGKQHPAVHLVPSDEPERDLRDVLSVVAVSDLPWAHGPFNCAHADRYTPLPGAEPSDPESQAAAGAQFFLSLTQEDIAACPYHQADWAGLAKASITLLQRLPARADHSDVTDLARELWPDDDTRPWLIDLFADPIVYTVGATSVTNGQHRACAARAARAPQIVAEVHGWHTERNAPRDPYRVAAATLARYWASRAAT